MKASRLGAVLAVVLLLTIIAGATVAYRIAEAADRIHVTAYFANSNGIFVGDEVRILGVPVGTVERIEPQPNRVKIDFWVNDTYKVPRDAKAAILNPTLVSARAIQLVPAYTSGPVMADHSVIGEDRTAVPVEWDDVRGQLQRLADTLQPTEPGGVSSFGELINTAADNVRGQGGNVRDTIMKLSQALSILGDHSTDVFATVRNVSVLVAALHDSADVLEQLNRNLSAVTALLANNPTEVGAAVHDFSQAAHDLADFLAANRDTVGVTSEKLSALAQTLGESLDDIKQTLHVAPNTLANYNNIYQPAQGGGGGVLAVANFTNPMQFLCGAVQAASRLNSEQAAKLCVQYLAPIVKNRQYNFPPVGTSIGLAAPFPVAGATARPNELTYSEDWMRPDYIPPNRAPSVGSAPLPAEAPGPSAAGSPAAPPESGSAGDDASPTPTDPQQGLTGMMVPAGAGS